MKMLFLNCLAVAMCLCAMNSHALDISIGSINTRPASSATVDIVFSNVPTNPISAFAIYLASTPDFGMSSVSVGAQPNITLFVDDFSNGVYRVTGLVLDGPAIGNGVVARLNFSTPSNAIPGVYPIAIAALPNSAPLATNPETRDLVMNSPLVGTAVGGSITVTGAATTPPVISSIVRQTSGAMLLTIRGDSGASYRIEASTNLTHWLQIAVTNPPGSSFHFVDDDATNQPLRFYRASY